LINIAIEITGCHVNEKVFSKSFCEEPGFVAKNVKEMAQKGLELSGARCFLIPRSCVRCMVACRLSIKKQRKRSYENSIQGPMSELP
jgi:hypothetical protein